MKVKGKRKEVTALQILLLIRRGAKAKLQIFFSNIGQRKQVFRTRAYWEGVFYYCYHYAPFPLMVDNSGRIITDRTAANFQNRPFSC